MEAESMYQLTSAGRIEDQILVCQYLRPRLNRKVLWYRTDSVSHNVSMLTCQIFIMFIVGRISYLLLRPCHQTLIISQITGGIVLGPLFLGRHDSLVEMIFPVESRMTLSTFAEFGIVIHFFKVGVQISLKEIFKIEKQAAIIGLVGHMCALLLSGIVFSIVRVMNPQGFEGSGTGILVVITSVTAYPVISSFLTEMNILNSEIGRMALSATMISETVMWTIHFFVSNALKSAYQKSYIPIMELATISCYFSVLFFILRPLVVWISNKTSEGKPMRESHFVSIICIVMFVGFSGSVVGLPPFLIAFWFGLTLPDGPPLGSAMAQRLDTIGYAFIVPAYCTISGMRTSVPSLVESKSASIEIVLVSVYIGKCVGIILTSLHFRIPFLDSLALALTMCSKGIVDLVVLNNLLNVKEIGEVSFSLAIYNSVAFTGFITVVVYYIYDPSRRYRTYKRKSIIESQQDLDLRILVCVHNEENVYPIINLLQAFNPTKVTPLSVFALHLIELKGRATSILTRNKNSSHYKSSHHINNVFDQFQQHNKESATLQCFISVAPYASMHEDICYMAMDTKSNIVILPFHSQLDINENVEHSNASIRTVNQKVLKQVPCSVGILIDRSQISGNPLDTYEKSLCEIAMVFLGGGDDQEALACSLRIAQNPHVKLTVFWIRVKMQQSNQMNVKNPYIDLMEHIRYSNSHKGKVTFKEEIVEDGIGTTRVIRSLEEHFSLVIVGRHHVADSPCTLGLTEWCEIPELGPLGNLLASSDFTLSVLIVQQQPPFSYELRYIS